jgi:hypothetical protein
MRTPTGVHFIDAHAVTAVAAYGTILKAAICGLTWVEQSPKTPAGGFRVKLPTHEPFKGSSLTR